MRYASMSLVGSAASHPQSGEEMGNSQSRVPRHDEHFCPHMKKQTTICMCFMNARTQTQKHVPAQVYSHPPSLPPSCRLQKFNGDLSYITKTVNSDITEWMSLLCLHAHPNAKETNSSTVKNGLTHLLCLHIQAQGKLEFMFPTH